jgi:hypothetical protein
MKRVKPLLLVMVVTLTLTGYSQELSRHVFCTAGDHHKTAVVELAWTIGQAEPEATTFHPTVILCSGFQQQDDMLVSVEETEDGQEILFYPNPCSGQAFMKISLKTASDVTYTMYDLHGRIVLNGELQGQSYYYKHLDLGDLPPGIYNLFISYGSDQSNPIKSLKIIKK